MVDRLSPAFRFTEKQNCFTAKHLLFLPDPPGSQFVFFYGRKVVINELTFLASRVVLLYNTYISFKNDQDD